MEKKRRPSSAPGGPLSPSADDMSLWPLLRAKDVAELLAITTAALSQMRWRGDGPAYIKIGRNVRYDPKDVEAYLEEQRG